MLLIGVLLSIRAPVYAQSDIEAKIGGDRPIQMGRATWDTGWFQAEIYRQLLLELGYSVERPRTFDNADFYSAATLGEVDFWANGWFPLHDAFLTDDIEVLGDQVRGGVVQGYLVDKDSAELLNIESLADFSRPEVVEHFDQDNDGIAELIGCNVGWVCGQIIEHHLDSYALRDTVEHVRGDYGPLMSNAIERFSVGEPILFYTWTPNWTIGELVPGRDVVWVGVPFLSVPDGQEFDADQAINPNIIGCTISPCLLGFPPSDILTVANKDFLLANPAIRALLESVVIPIDDISAQNALLIEGEEEQADIERHAADWIAANRGVVNGWLETAVSAHDETVIVERATETETESTQLAPLRIATKPLAPFVIYDINTREYTGFSIELWKLIAREADLEYELYGVNTLAKLLDEVERGAADAATAGIGITEQREGVLDFSHAYFESGLQIMIAAEERGLWGDSLASLTRAIFSPQLFEVLSILMLCLLIAAHIMWFSERHINEDFSESYWPGIWEAFWWSAVTATTVGYGDKTPKTIPGRIIGLIWMFSGLFVLASFTASIATTFAINEVNTHITGPDDLPGKRVATIERSTAEGYLTRQGIRPVLFEHEDDAYEALVNDEVDAIVYDAPVLQHHVTLDEGKTVQLAGVVFQEQPHGVAISQNPELREQINRALLRLIESGEYAALYHEWFGDE
ncbi:MAG: glycine betaine/L-proline ABC transporter substrate-binding protein ProX [Chloroflexota bacterium]